MSTYNNIPIVIVCRDRLTPLRLMVNRLEEMGYTNLVFVDNQSTYEPTIEYLCKLQNKGYRWHKTTNYGHRVLELSGLYKEFADKPYVLSDCDCVPSVDCPDNFMEQFYNIMTQYNVAKVGFSLKVDDLPDCYKDKQEVIGWEQQFRLPALEINNVGWKAPIDTTFALCNVGVNGSWTNNSIRCYEPLSCNHYTWYYDSNKLPEDELYYRANKLTDIGHWSGKN